MTTDTLNIVLKQTSTGDGAKKTASGLDNVRKAAALLSGAFAVVKSAEFAVDLAKVGAAARRQAGALDSMAKSAGTSGGAIVSAMQEASQFTIDKMAAMEAANKAMVMEVAQSPAEFERLTKVATALGRVMGQDAPKSIDDFITASARQSQQIADNLGLTVTVGQATERFAKANNIAADAMTDAQKKAAFLAMMLEEGEKKMAALGETTLDSAATIEQTSAAWEDTKTAVGEALLAMGEAAGVMDALPKRARNVAKGFEAIAEHGYTARGVLASWTAILDKDRTMVDAYVAEMERLAEAEQIVATNIAQTSDRQTQYQEALESTQRATDAAALASYEYAQKQELVAAAVGTGESWNQYQAALNATAAGENAAAEAALANIAAQEAQAKAAASAAAATAGLAASLKDATDAQIAQAAISELGRALSAEEITAETYATAVQETQVAFGLADAQSIALTGSLSGLTEALASGQLKASDYNEALATAIAQSYSAGVEADAFASALAGIPDKKTVTLEYNIVTRGSPPSGATGGETLGGDAQALGTGFAMGGTTLVGERGPELVRLPRGAQVFSAGQTRGMMRGMGGGSTISIGPVYIQSDDPAVIWRKLERYARLKGKSSGPQLGR